MSSEWVMAAAALVNFVIVTSLAVITKRYADETRRIAQMPRGRRLGQHRPGRTYATMRPHGPHGKGVCGSS